MARKIKSNPHNLYAHEIRGNIILYKNNKVIRNDLFYGKSKRKIIMKEYFDKIKKNKNNDIFYINIIHNI